MNKGFKIVKKLLILPVLTLACSLSSVPANAAELFYTTARVNLRSAANTSSSILAVTPRGAEIFVDEYNPNGWSKVSYSGTSGYMSSDFISTSASSGSTGNRVELTPWSEAKKVFKIGQTAHVYDVYTGITYNVKSFSNGSHADVEPVTKEDTAALKRTYGGTWSWTPRPVWVTINGKTMAASINGMPHGGGVNNNNGMNGQVCIHFKGSTTHNGNASFARLHQEKATEAYNLSK